MTQLIIALATFVGTHFLLSHPLRDPLAAKLGEAAFQGVYSVVALVTLGWAVLAFRAAPYGEPGRVSSPRNRRAACSRSRGTR